MRWPIAHSSISIGTPSARCPARRLRVPAKWDTLGVVDDTEGAKLVLWDIDHTLIETRGVGGRLARAAFEQITGKQPEEMAEATGNTERVILAETLRTHDIEPTDAYQERYALALPD